MGYKLLGFIVWKAGIWFAKRKIGQALPPGRATAAAIVVVAVAGAVAVRASKERTA